MAFEVTSLSSVRIPSQMGLQRVPDFSSPKETIRDPASVLAGSIVVHLRVGKDYPEWSYHWEENCQRKAPRLT
jgi:hypothetical protein